MKVRRDYFYGLDWKKPYYRQMPEIPNALLAAIVLLKQIAAVPYCLNQMDCRGRGSSYIVTKSAICSLHVYNLCTYIFVSFNSLIARIILSYSKIYINHEIRFKHFSRSWIKFSLHWFTANQSSKYTTRRIWRVFR